MERLLLENGYCIEDAFLGLKEGLFLEEFVSLLLIFIILHVNTLS